MTEEQGGRRGQRPTPAEPPVRAATGAAAAGSARLERLGRPCSRAEGAGRQERTWPTACADRRAPPTVPLVELRLRVPFAGRPARGAKSDATWRRRRCSPRPCCPVPLPHDRSEIAERAAGLGGALSAGADADRLLVSGSVLRRSRELLVLLGDV